MICKTQVYSQNKSSGEFNSLWEETCVGGKLLYYVITVNSSTSFRHKCPGLAFDRSQLSIVIALQLLSIIVGNDKTIFIEKERNCLLRNVKNTLLAQIDLN